MRIVARLMVAVALAACATAPPSKEARQPVFYPALPNPPRIQYLTTLSSEQDLGKSRSAFADFIVGKPREAPGTIKKPYGVGFFGGKVYVVDTRGPGYEVFDLEQNTFKFVEGSGAGKMQSPINIAIDQDGTKYVTDTALNQVLVFDRNDRFLKAFGVKDQFRPADVAAVEARLYVVDSKNHQIQVLDKHSGNLLFKFGQRGSAEGDLYFPTNITTGPDGLLYVTDTGNSRVQKFSLDGKFVRSYGALGRAPGQFARPKGLAIDRQGQMYVVDAAFENVQIFDSEGRLLLFFGEPGASPENLNLPTAVVIDYDSARLFQKYADPRFKVEYVIAVVSQFGVSKVNIFGFGKMETDSAASEPSIPPRE